MSPISAISSATSQPTTALLQVLLAQYINLANSPNWQGKADYEALQNAIDAGNVSAAMVALGRLQREGKAQSSHDVSAVAPEASASTQTISDNPNGPSDSVGEAASGGTFNVTA